MNNHEDIFLKLIGKEKNTYELATLYAQNRRNINVYTFDTKFNNFYDLTYI